MIRLFVSICKTHKKLKNCNELLLLKKTSDFQILPSCPSCTAPPDGYVKNGSYTRNFVCIVNGSIHDETVTINVKKCSSCNHSHALLHFLIVPYSRYSLGFLITLMYYRLTNRFGTVNALCKHFDISINTYHRIMHRLKQDSHALMLAMDMVSKNLVQLRFLSCGPLEKISSILDSFFKISGHSFMQPCVTLRITWSSS